MPQDAVVNDIKVKPDDGDVILVATNKGVFRSDDGGKTWKPSNEGLPQLFIQRLAFAPSQPNRVYLTLLTTARDGERWNGGVFRSDDGGRTWRECDDGLKKIVGKSLYEQSNYNEIVVDPENADIVYVGGRSWWVPGVFKSEDGGASWEWVSHHTPPDKNMDYGWIDFWGPAVECLAISPVDPKRLAFGTSGHLFLSEDGGKSWHQAYCFTYPDGRFRGNGLEVTCLNSIVPDPKRRNRLYFCYADIGLLISDDGGLTFKRSGKGMKGEGNCFTVLVDPESNNTIWAGTGQWAWNEGYICKSEDGGESWRVVGKGLPNGQVRHIVLDLRSPVGKRRLLATVNGYGFYESTDDGEDWRCINGDLPEEAFKQPRGILLDPKDGKHILVACAGKPRFAGVYETRDGGKSWRLLNEERIFADIQGITADPKNFTTLFLAVREYYDQEEKKIYPGGVFKSVDGGRRWERMLDFHFVSSVVVSPANSDLIYAATTDHPYHDDCVAEGVLRSSDGGKSWRRACEGLSHLNISCLSIDPFDPSRLYLGTGGNGAFIGKDYALSPPLQVGFWQISPAQARQFPSDESIKRLLRELARIGMKCHIIQYTGWEIEGAFRTLYPSKIYPQIKEWEKRDPVFAMLRYADELKGEVYLGLFPLLTDKPKEEELRRWEEESFKLMREIIQRYGKHPSLKGIYLPPEVHYKSGIDQRDWKRLVDRFSDFCHSHSLKLIVPVGLYLQRENGKWLRATPEALSSFWSAEIREGKADIFLLIDGIGTGMSDFQSAEDCERWLGEECRKAGKEVWIEVEAFDADYRACDFARFKKQIELAFPYADRIAVFDIPHYFSPDGLNTGARELYEEYIGWLRR